MHPSFTTRKGVSLRSRCHLWRSLLKTAQKISCKFEVKLRVPSCMHCTNVWLICSQESPRLIGMVFGVCAKSVQGPFKTWLRYSACLHRCFGNKVYLAYIYDMEKWASFCRWFCSYDVLLTRGNHEFVRDETHIHGALGAHYIVGAVKISLQPFLTHISGRRWHGIIKVIIKWVLFRFNARRRSSRMRSLPFAAFWA